MAGRRSLRPSDEYRVPTDDEWQEFLGHFWFAPQRLHRDLRPGVLATPCIHEHACVRCPMLWPDPAPRTRLVDIADNLTARITEAEREGWPGEVDGLQISLAGANNKLAQIDSRARLNQPQPSWPGLSGQPTPPNYQPTMKEA